jgi:hypothetical protein
MLGQLFGSMLGSAASSYIPVLSKAGGMAIGSALGGLWDQRQADKRNISMQKSAMKNQISTARDMGISPLAMLGAGSGYTATGSISGDIMKGLDNYGRKSYAKAKSESDLIHEASETRLNSAMANYYNSRAMFANQQGGTQGPRGKDTLLSIYEELLEARRQNREFGLSGETEIDLPKSDSFDSCASEFGDIACTPYGLVRIMQSLGLTASNQYKAIKQRASNHKQITSQKSRKAARTGR